MWVSVVQERVSGSRWAEWKELWSMEQRVTRTQFKDTCTRPGSPP